jgi:hypothetical protein
VLMYLPSLFDNVQMEAVCIVSFLLTLYNLFFIGDALVKWVILDIGIVFTPCRMMWVQTAYKTSVQSLLNV